MSAKLAVSTDDITSRPINPCIPTSRACIQHAGIDPNYFLSLALSLDYTGFPDSLTEILSFHLNFVYSPDVFNRLIFQRLIGPEPS